MHQSPTPADPLPKQLRWFAPWRWKRQWRLCFLALMVAYPASFGPLVWLHDRHRLPPGTHEILHEVFIAVYFPLALVIHTGWDFGLLKRYVESWESFP